MIPTYGHDGEKTQLMMDTAPDQLMPKAALSATDFLNWTCTAAIDHDCGVGVSRTFKQVGCLMDALWMLN